MRRGNLVYLVLLIPALLLFSKQFVFALFPIVQPNKIDPTILACNLTNSRIDSKIEKFTTVKVNHIELFTKLSDRLSQNINKWKDIGFDTGKLEKDLKNLNDLVDKYKTDIDALLTRLAELKTLCGTANYSGKLSQTKEALKLVRKDVVNIRILYQTSIRQHVLDLKNQNVE